MTPPHAPTLQDLLARVHRPGRLLRIMLYNLEACFDANGSAFVRLGDATIGRRAMHLIVYDDAGAERVFGRFDNTHGDQQDHDPHPNGWSAVRTSLNEVEGLVDILLRRRLAA